MPATSVPTFNGLSSHPTSPACRKRLRARLRHTALHAAMQALLLLACALALPARADEDMQRERLARIAGELKVVEDMVAQAGVAAQTDPPGRVRFRYDWLQGDLRLVRQGIEQQIDVPLQPRPVPPLQGDYRR